MSLEKALCLICEQPTADGAVEAVHVDKEKLQTWFPNVCESELEEIEDDNLICYYCLWHAENWSFRQMCENNSFPLRRPKMACACGKEKALFGYYRDEDVSMLDSIQDTNATNGSFVDDMNDFESPSSAVSEFLEWQIFGEQASLLLVPFRQQQPSLDQKEIIAHDHCYNLVHPDIKVTKLNLTLLPNNKENLDVSGFNLMSPLPCPTLTTSGNSGSSGSQCVAATPFPFPTLPQPDTSPDANINLLLPRQWSNRTSSEGSEPIPRTGRGRDGCRSGRGRGRGREASKPEVPVCSAVPVVAPVEVLPPPAKRGSKDRGKQMKKIKIIAPTAEKRRIRHNTNERDRRAKLAKLLDNLRSVLPKVSEKPLSKAKTLDLATTSIVKILNMKQATSSLRRRYLRARRRLSREKLARKVHGIAGTEGNRNQLL
ncbi:Hypothetical predicted protein [Cloeon dipterum]|uniref:BHLH domain-containing protein n=1 Tax=Cloeon dipterum TaxID=197152 RepID=A0A8S1CS61_9INSE|nr:Hypothetical predicted protein [Cloeon dipterum]